MLVWLLCACVLGLSVVAVAEEELSIHFSDAALFSSANLGSGVGGAYSPPEGYRYSHISPCTIPTERDITYARFVQTYLGRAPVVLLNATSNSAFAGAVTSERLLASHGQREVILASSNTFSHDKKTTTFAEYLQRCVRVCVLWHPICRVVSFCIHHHEYTGICSQ